MSAGDWQHAHPHIDTCEGAYMGVPPSSDKTDRPSFPVEQRERERGMCTRNLSRSGRTHPSVASGTDPPPLPDVGCTEMHPAGWGLASASPSPDNSNSNSNSNSNTKQKHTQRGHKRGGEPEPEASTHTHTHTHHFVSPLWKNGSQWCCAQSPQQHQSRECVPAVPNRRGPWVCWCKDAASVHPLPRLRSSTKRILVSSPLTPPSFFFFCCPGKRRMGFVFLQSQGYKIFRTQNHHKDNNRKGDGVE